MARLAQIASDLRRIRIALEDDVQAQAEYESGLDVRGDSQDDVIERLKKLLSEP